MADEITIDAAKLTRVVEAIVLKGGSNQREAGLVATNLVEANLKGHDSHGVGMIPRYIESLKEGGLQVNKAPKIVLDTGPLVRLDGQSGYGQVVGHDSMAIAIESRATRVLPDPTSPCSRRCMRVGAAMSASISASAVRCEAVSSNGSPATMRARMEPLPAVDRPARCRAPCRTSPSAS